MNLIIPLAVLLGASILIIHEYTRKYEYRKDLLFVCWMAIAWCIVKLIGGRYADNYNTHNLPIFFSILDSYLSAIVFFGCIWLFFFDSLRSVLESFFNTSCNNKKTKNTESEKRKNGQS